MAKFSRAFAQFEREMMLARQREGIAKAKAENRYLGRREERTVTQIAAALSIGRGGFYRALEAAGTKRRLVERPAPRIRDL
jgi:DNA invertase Pin-like site-specific DNA recombinase